VDRLRRAFQEHAGGAVEQALLALFAGAIVGGAYVARIGTTEARASVAAVVALLVVWQIAYRVVRRRERRDVRRTLRRVLFTTDPAAGARAMRALTLVERTSKDDTAGSPELAQLHFDRLLERVSSASVTTAAKKYAQRYRGLAVMLLSLATLGVFVAPARVVEGLDVLLAKNGRAPMTMSWLAYPRLSAQPASYTRESERALVFGTSVELSMGTVLTVRGVPRVLDRALVLTDGTREEAFTSDGAGGVVARYVVRSNALLRVASRFGAVRIDDDDTLDVTVVPDDPPTVELDGAPRTVKLSDAERIELRWTARDDHGLREADLVLRSGPREERRTLGRFDGESKLESGGHVLPSHDAFLRRMFLPIRVTIEVKDNDPYDGPKWTASAPIIVIPPEVGEPESARFAAVAKLRDAVVDYLGWLGAKPESPADRAADRAKESAGRAAELRAQAASTLSRSYSGAPFPARLRTFIEGQFDLLARTRGAPTERGVEQAALAVDVALRALGNHDAADVSKRLGDVAEEAATGARLGREGEHGKDGVERLDTAIDVLDKGIRHLSVLAALGEDIGSVATADLARVRRSRQKSDWMHAELAALHLAARLRRPMPSFGSTTGHGGGGGGGVESGQGQGGDQDSPSPSDANEEFERVAQQVEALARDHENALHGVENALDDAASTDATDADREQAKKLATKIRDAAEPLPLPGEEFGTPRASAALAREHANATAHSVENLSLSEAKENADNALGALDEAEHRLDADDPLRQNFAEMRRALRDARDFAEQKLAERRAAAEAKARDAVTGAGDAERDLSEKASKLAENQPGRDGAALPRELADQIGRAGSVMKEAAEELTKGHGERGLELQREAQRLLEQSQQSRSDQQKSNGDDSGDQKGDSRQSAGEHGENGKDPSLGGEVPGPDGRAGAEEFRRRVLEGLAHESSERLSPAVRRYAEGLLR
jgi:hypothetical protein